MAVADSTKHDPSAQVDNQRQVVQRESRNDSSELRNTERGRAGLIPWTRLATTTLWPFQPQQSWRSRIRKTCRVAALAVAAGVVGGGLAWYYCVQCRRKASEEQTSSNWIDCLLDIWDNGVVDRDSAAPRPGSGKARVRGRTLSEGSHDNDDDEATGDDEMERLAADILLQALTRRTAQSDTGDPVHLASSDSDHSAGGAPVEGDACPGERGARPRSGSSNKPSERGAKDVLRQGEARRATHKEKINQYQSSQQFPRQAAAAMVRCIDVAFVRNQTAADKTAQSNLSRIHAYLSSRFDLRSLTANLRDSSLNLTAQEKHDCFDEVKVRCFARFFSAFYVVLCRLWVHRIEVNIVGRKWIPQMLEAALPITWKRRGVEQLIVLDRLATENSRLAAAACCACPRQLHSNCCPPERVVQYVGAGQSVAAVLESQVRNLRIAYAGARPSLPGSAVAPDHNNNWENVFPPQPENPATVGWPEEDDPASSDYDELAYCFLLSSRWLEFAPGVHTIPNLVHAAVTARLGDVPPQSETTAAQLEALLEYVCQDIDRSLFFSGSHRPRVQEHKIPTHPPNATWITPTDIDGPDVTSLSSMLLPEFISAGVAAATVVASPEFNGVNRSLDNTAPAEPRRGLVEPVARAGPLEHEIARVRAASEGAGGQQAHGLEAGITATTAEIGSILTGRSDCNLGRRRHSAPGGDSSCPDEEGERRGGLPGNSSDVTLESGGPLHSAAVAARRGPPGDSLSSCAIITTPSSAGDDGSSTQSSGDVDGASANRRRRVRMPPISSEEGMGEFGRLSRESAGATHEGKDATAQRRPRGNQKSGYDSESSSTEAATRSDTSRAQSGKTSPSSCAAPPPFELPVPRSKRDQRLLIASLAEARDVLDAPCFFASFLDTRKSLMAEFTRQILQKVLPGGRQGGAAAASATVPLCRILGHLCGLAEAICAESTYGTGILGQTSAGSLPPTNFSHGLLTSSNQFIDIFARHPAVDAISWALFFPVVLASRPALD